MKSQLRTAVSLALSVVALSTARGAEVNINGTVLVVPEPTGFVPISDPSSTLARADRATDSAEYVTLARLFPKSYEQNVQSGVAPGVARSLVAKVPRALTAFTLQPQEFPIVKANSRKACAPRDDISKRLAQIAANAGARLKDEIGHDPEIALGVPVPLPVHDDTHNTIGCSYVVKIQGTSPDGQVVAEILTFTNLDVYVKGKVAMLTVYGGNADLQWTRSTARSWADSILGANRAPNQSRQ